MLTRLGIFNFVTNVGKNYLKIRLTTQLNLSGCLVVRLSGCHVVKFDPWDMLNNFCFHVYAQKSVF